MSLLKQLYVILYLETLTPNPHAIKAVKCISVLGDIHMGNKDGGEDTIQLQCNLLFLGGESS